MPLLLLEQVKLVNICFTRAWSPSWRLPVQSSRNSPFPINRKQPWRTFWLAQILSVIDGKGAGGLSQVACLVGAEPSLELWCQTLSSAADA